MGKAYKTMKSELEAEYGVEGLKTMLNEKPFRVASQQYKQLENLMEAHIDQVSPSPMKRRTSSSNSSSSRISADMLKQYGGVPVLQPSATIFGGPSEDWKAGGVRRPVDRIVNYLKYHAVQPADWHKEPQSSEREVTKKLFISLNWQEEWEEGRAYSQKELYKMALEALGLTESDAALQAVTKQPGWCGVTKDSKNMKLGFTEGKETVVRCKWRMCLDCTVCTDRIRQQHFFSYGRCVLCYVSRVGCGLCKRKGGVQVIAGSWAVRVGKWRVGPRAGCRICN